MEIEFPFTLYSDQDPDYSNTSSISPFKDQMPSKRFWKDFYENYRKPILKPLEIPYELYTDNDPLYTETPAISPFIDQMPSTDFWLDFSKKLVESQKSSHIKRKNEPRIGYQILMNLGGRSNPEFMAQEDQMDVPKDLSDGSGLGYTIDPELAQYRPDPNQIIQRLRRVVPASQKVSILEMKPSEHPISDDAILLGPIRSDLGHSHFCAQSSIETLFKKKELFKPISEMAFEQARKKANPYESIGKAIFMNRAAVKIANIDFLYNLTNTNEFDKPSSSDVSQKDLFYFADICAGPGGFTDYMYWRLDKRARGFGMTLRDQNIDKAGHDWASFENFYRTDLIRSFQISYGEDETGSIYSLNNIMFFRQLIQEKTNGEMVSLVTGDGGIAVDGEENDQERLVKRLVMCQFLCALGILRKGGNFVCKVFDVLTDFHSSLLYLVAQCFERFSIVKPYTSRPANNERYIVFLGLREESPQDVFNVLSRANESFQSLNPDETDVMSVFPIEKIPEYFGEYLRASNEELIQGQIDAVDDLLCYAYDPELPTIDQADVTERCMKEWRVPRNKFEDQEWQRQKMLAKEKEEEQLRELERRQRMEEERLRLQQQLLQQQQAIVIEEEIEEKDEEYDPQFTLLGSIISKYRKERRGEIIKAVFSTEHENTETQSPTYFSFE